MRARAAVGTWRSLVARTLGVREVAGSNPVVPTIRLCCRRREGERQAAPADAVASRLPPCRGVAAQHSRVSMPHILVTNDDGIGAAGLRALAAAMRALGTVSIVAPSGERSATAQSITLRQPIACERLADGAWAVEGTPADAVIVALNRLLTVPPDLVVSGINRGGNMGENIFYSGTVGAAAEAVIHGVPALAISLFARDGEYRYEDAAAVARQLAERVLRDGLPEGVLLNVNVPAPWNGGVRFTRQSRRITRNLLQEGTDPRGRRYFWLHDQKVADGFEPDTDYAAVQDGAVSITPLEIERTHLPSLNHLSHWAKELERSLHR